MTKAWRKNERDGRGGWFNSQDVTLFLDSHKDEYKEFLNKYNLPHFGYDMALFNASRVNDDDRKVW